LHYLILCKAETILPRLFRQVVMPPTVSREMQQPNTPPPVRQWASALPEWCIVQSPKTALSVKDIAARMRLGASKGAYRNLRDHTRRGSPPATGQAPPSR
jgi:hypothetical protein